MHHYHGNSLIVRQQYVYFCPNNYLSFVNTAKYLAFL